MYKLIPFIICILLYSCSKNSNESKHFELGNAVAQAKNKISNSTSKAAGDAEQEPTNGETSLKKGSKIIKHGEINFEVTKLEKAKTKVDSILKSVNGYYENENYDDFGSEIKYTLKLRIPNAKFDGLVYTLEKDIGKLLSKNISAKDVTEEYVDLNIRLENNLSYLNQYKSILSKAKTIKEILEVQEKIRQIEEEIESKKGRLKYLNDKVNYSTLDLKISELIPFKLSKKRSFGSRVAGAFNNGVAVFLNFIIGLINIWPFLLLLTLLILLRKPILNIIRVGKKKGA